MRYRYGSCGGKRCGIRLTTVEAALHILENSDNVFGLSGVQKANLPHQKKQRSGDTFRTQAFGAGIENA
jgi:hypothetical protein